MRMLTASDIPLFAQWELERPYPWTDRNFQETLQSRATRTFVWDEAGDVVGFAVIQLVGDEAYLQNILVAPHQRRKGFGEKILQKVMMWAKIQGALELWLDVEANNQAAIALYQKAQMIVSERRPHSYPRGEDALVMRREL